jgi:glycosyltransferase involved in cell wall biosynthesis
MSPTAIRICHVVTKLELGGAQQNTLHTVASLRPPFRASLVCGSGGLLDHEARSLSHVPVAFVERLVRPLRPVDDAAALAQLTRIFRRDSPHVVHTHSSKAGILGRLAARLARVPVVVHSIHGFGFNDEQPRALRAVLIAAERAAKHLTTHFIAVSHANLRQGIALGIVPGDRASVIRSGIAIAEFERAAADPALRNGAGLRRELGLDAGTPLVGMVACLKKQKAPLDFVEVAARVAPECPDAVWVMVGDGELRGEIEALIRARGLGGRLMLLGWRRDVARIMAALDVLVLTSSWEGLPRVLPEAIASGVPIVATAVDGSAEILVDGTTGLVCAPHDVGGLASRVEALLRQPELGRSLAGRARAVLGEFDIDAMVRAQEELYLELLRRAGIRPEPHVAQTIESK